MRPRPPRRGHQAHVEAGHRSERRQVEQAFGVHARGREHRVHAGVLQGAGGAGTHRQPVLACAGPEAAVGLHREAHRGRTGEHHARAGQCRVESRAGHGLQAQGRAGEHGRAAGAGLAAQREVFTLGTQRDHVPFGELLWHGVRIHAGSLSQPIRDLP
ncbi:hypothetical protein [Alkalisalibacterium limincola]|uniref:hypothetical protein n=1 Tax=Alkalisalibacterium limincola TaxID=2699169 RepID=UPI002102E999|nr:hypothetical protein [Alkalisalibacterium limincola]